MIEENGHGPIEAGFREVMQAVAKVLDSTFNGEATGDDREIAFVLLIAPFGGEPGRRTNYVSNGRREDIIAMMREVIERFEAQTPKVGEDGL